MVGGILSELLKKDPNQTQIIDLSAIAVATLANPEDILHCAALGLQDSLNALAPHIHTHSSGLGADIAPILASLPYSSCSIADHFQPAKLLA